MRSPRDRFGKYLGSYPLSDRATFIYDGSSGFWCGIFNGLALPLIGVVGRKLGMGSGMLALLMGSQFVGLLLNLWFGHLSRSGDLVAYVFWPSFLARSSLALVALVVSPIAFLLVMGSYYIVSCLAGPAYSSIMRSNYSDANRGRAMGHIRIMMMTVSALCAAFAGAFFQVFPEGYRIIFPAAAVAGALSSLMFRKVKPRMGAGKRQESADKPRESFRQSLAFLCRDKGFLVYMAIYFVMGFPDKIMIPLEPIRLVDELGAGYGAAGLVLGTVPLAGAVLGYFLCSRLANKSDPFLLLVATVFLSSTRFLGFALAGVPVHLMPGSFLNGVANAGWDLLPLFTILLFAKGEKLGLYMGLFNTLVGLRGLMGPALGTWLYEGLGMRIIDIYWVAFAIEVAGGLLLLAFWIAFRQGRIMGITEA
jgi:MFS family permease